MPALNIPFTEAELAQLRERARKKGISMTALVHDAAVNCTSRTERDALIKAAYENAKTISAGLLHRLAGK